MSETATEDRRRSRPLPAATAVAFLLLVVAVPSCAAGESASGLGAPEATAILAEVAPEVEAIRGLRFERPVEARVIDDARARAHVTRRFKKFYTDEEASARQRVLRLLGLVPPTTDVLGEVLDVIEEQAGGFYDPETESFFLLGDMPRGMLPMLASHELDHALEDQHFDLDARLRAAPDDDDAFAVCAVHEGSATLVMTVWASRAAAASRLRAEDLTALRESDAGRGAKLQEMPAVLRRELIGSYILGAAFLLRGRPAASVGAAIPVSDVNRAFRDGPRSSEQILHPEKYWDAARRDEPLRVEIRKASRVLGTGYEREGDGVLGELSIGVLVGAGTPGIDEAAGRPADAWTSVAASGWGGDRWEVWSKGGRGIAILATAWDSEKDAEEFAAALPSRDGLAWARAGDRVAVVAGEAGCGLADVAREIVRGMRVGRGAR